MTGSIFINHTNGFACSNDAAYSATDTPVFHEGTHDIKEIKRGWRVVVRGIFQQGELLTKGTECQMVFKNEENDTKYGFIGQVFGITSENTIINISHSTNEISKILSNITSKIKDNGR